jgi:hypothetical protein
VRLTALEDNGVLAANPVDLQLDVPKVVTGLAPSRFRADVTSSGACFQKAPPIFDLKSGDFGAPIVLTMQAAGSIMGVITAADNRTPYEVSVISLENHSRDSMTRIAYADASRHFSFADLPPGRYRVSVLTLTPLRETTAEVEVTSGGVPTPLTIAAPAN